MRASNAAKGIANEAKTHAGDKRASLPPPPGHVHKLVLDALSAAIGARTQWRRQGPNWIHPDKHGNISVIAGPATTGAKVIAHMRRLQKLMAQAHPFTIEDDGLQNEMIPDPDRIEMEAFNEGLLPDPFPVYTLTHRRPSGNVLYLCWAGVARLDDGTMVPALRAAQFETVDGTNSVSAFPTITVIERVGTAMLETLTEYDEKALEEGAVPDKFEGIRLARRIEDPLNGVKPAIQMCRETGQMDGVPETTFEDFDFLTKESISVVRMLAAINAPSSEVEVEPAPKFANRKRRAKGFVELKASYHVRIVPRAMARAIAEAEREGRASPRLHWRRAHVRRMPTGGIRLIARQIIGLGGRDASEFKVGPNAYLVGRKAAEEKP